MLHVVVVIHPNGCKVFFCVNRAIYSFYCSWTFGEFFCVDAANIIELSKKYNIKVEMVDIDSGEALII